MQALEAEWCKRVYFPFFNKYQHLLANYTKISNPYLVCNDMINGRILSSSNGFKIKTIKLVPLNVWNSSWSNISSNSGITMQDIINHPEYPWIGIV